MDLYRSGDADIVL